MMVRCPSPLNMFSSRGGWGMSMGTTVGVCADSRNGIGETTDDAILVDVNVDLFRSLFFQLIIGISSTNSSYSLLASATTLFFTYISFFAFAMLEFLSSPLRRI